MKTHVLVTIAPRNEDAERTLKKLRETDSWLILAIAAEVDTELRRLHARFCERDVAAEFGVGARVDDRADLIASLATVVRDLYMGYPAKELHEHPRDLLARVITYFDERGELDDDMRSTWEVD